MEYSKETLVKLCKYYTGEYKNPYEGLEQNKAMLFFYEKCWVSELINGNAHRMMEEYCEYLRYNLPEMYNDDVMPLTYKAMLLDRYMHFGGSSNGFVELFNKYYIDK